VHPQRIYLCALSVPSSFSRLIHELNELFSVNKGATLVAMTSIPRSSYMCRRTSVRGSRMWTRPLTEGVRPWSWFAIASKSRSVERSDDRMIAQRTVYISSSERLISYERTVGFSDKRSSPGKENNSYQRVGSTSHDEASSSNTMASASRKIALNINTADRFQRVRC
jgi:hypothetical protein